MKLSLVVTVHGFGAFTDTCLNSITKQSYRDLDILLICAGKDEAVFEECERWAAGDARIRVCSAPFAGEAERLNEGLTAPLGQYLLFMEDTDSFCENALLTICEAANKWTPDCMIFSAPKNGHKTQSTAEGMLENTYLLNEKGLAEALINDWTAPSLQNKVFRTALFDGLQFQNSFRCTQQMMINDLLYKCKTCIISRKRILYSAPPCKTTDYLCASDQDLIFAWQQMQAFIKTTHPKLETDCARCIVRNIMKQLARMEKTQSCISACMDYYESLLDLLRKEADIIGKKQMGCVLRLKTFLLLRYRRRFGVPSRAKSHALHTKNSSIQGGCK